jgi:hypothetical protein
MAAAQAGSVVLTVREAGGVDRKGWPVTCGVPFADGQVKAESIAAGHWRLVDTDGREVPSQGQVATTWGVYPAGSSGFAKWMHVTFPADVPANQTRQYRLEYGPDVRNRTKTNLRVADKSKDVTITTGKGPGALKLVISREKFNVLDEVYIDVDGNGFGADDRIIAPRDAANLWVGYDYGGAVINRAKPEVVVEQAGPVMAVVRIKTKMDGRFESVVRIFAFAGSPIVRVQETLVHGPTGQDRSAVQPQAVVMKSHVLELPIRTNPKEAVATVGVGEALPEPPAFTEATAPLADGVKVSLEQDLDHPCIRGNVGDDLLSKAFNYNLHADSEKIASGKRSPGWIDVSDKRWGVTAAVRHFWQTFPKRLVAKADALRLEHWADGAQLDPLSRNYNWMGMAKTHDVMLYFHAGDAAAAKAQQAALGHIHEIFATCTPEYYCSTKAYGRQPLTPAVQDGEQLHPQFDAMASAGLNRQRNIASGFYYFRETEDDYGYFNFGDFLVGRYWGCQEYDPTYCMLEQFYRTGDLKYLEFSAETARHLYDIDYTHTYTPESSNYPQRSHDKRGSHFGGEDSHGQMETNTDPGHVFIAGLVNYWYLTGDPRAKDVIYWSFPCYLGEDWYRIGGGGTWRYLGGYLFTVMTYAYELTWDDRYVELMHWAVREYMAGSRSRHADGIWWDHGGEDDEGATVPADEGRRRGRRDDRPPASQPASRAVAYTPPGRKEPEASARASVAAAATSSPAPQTSGPASAAATQPKPYFCQTWLADSVTNGYTQYLEIYPGTPYRQAVESGVVKLADFMLAHGVTPDFDGIYMGVTKPTTESTGYQPTPQIYAGGMPNMVILTMAKAYHFTGDEKYADAARRLLAKACEHKQDLRQLKPVTQSTYYPPMALPYLDGTIPPRQATVTLAIRAPVNGWLNHCRQLARSFADRKGALFVGDRIAAACAPVDRRGRAFGNEAGWHLTDVLAAIDDLLVRHKPRYVVILVGSSELHIGHPERTDFEANYARLVARIVARGGIPVCATMPPCSHLEPWAWIYNTEVYQSSKMNRLPLIDLREIMKDGGLVIVNTEPAAEKVPPAEWVEKNRFADGFEPIVQRELVSIAEQIERKD